MTKTKTTAAVAAPAPAIEASNDNVVELFPLGTIKPITDFCEAAKKADDVISLRAPYHGRDLNQDPIALILGIKTPVRADARDYLRAKGYAEDDLFFQVARFDRPDVEVTAAEYPEGDAREGLDGTAVHVSQEDKASEIWLGVFADGLNEDGVKTNGIKLIRCA